MKTYTDYEIIKAAVEYIYNNGHGFTTIILREAIQNITGWTIWTGGECPALEGARVEVMFTSGNNLITDSMKTTIKAYPYGDIDIIAYRIIEPDISELRGWVTVGGVDFYSIYWASADGISRVKQAYPDRSWGDVKNNGWKVRKLTVEDISDE